MENETLLLALLNSAPVVDGVPTDRLGDAEGARAWLAEQGWQQAGNSARALREVRDALKAVVRGQAGPETLVQFVREVRSAPVLVAGEFQWQLDTASARSVAVHAVLEWNRLRVDSPGRLRSCGNPECELFLLDRSKANSARWCSMASCGNRMKARRHYQRSRSAD